MSRRRLLPRVMVAPSRHSGLPEGRGNADDSDSPTDDRGGRPLRGLARLRGTEPLPVDGQRSRPPPYRGPHRAVSLTPEGQHERVGHPEPVGETVGRRPGLPARDRQEASADLDLRGLGRREVEQGTPMPCRQGAGPGLESSESTDPRPCPSLVPSTTTRRSSFNNSGASLSTSPTVGLGLPRHQSRDRAPGRHSVPRMAPAPHIPRRSRRSSSSSSVPLRSPDRARHRITTGRRRTRGAGGHRAYRRRTVDLPWPLPRARYFPHPRGYPKAVWRTRRWPRARPAPSRA
jgi:hypothetical protein